MCIWWGVIIAQHSSWDHYKELTQSWQHSLIFPSLSCHVYNKHFQKMVTTNFACVASYNPWYTTYFEEMLQLFIQRLYSKTLLDVFFIIKCRQTRDCIFVYLLHENMHYCSSYSYYPLLFARIFDVWLPGQTVHSQTTLIAININFRNVLDRNMLRFN